MEEGRYRNRKKERKGNRIDNWEDEKNEEEEKKSYENDWRGDYKKKDRFWDWSLGGKGKGECLRSDEKDWSR